MKIESYKNYNEALNLASRNYITTATETIEKALELNPKDVDILNLRGLLKLLKCDFSKSFESFYTAMCYSNNNLSRKYVDILSSDEFKVFLGRYNHSIRFINEDLNQESIYILNNIIEDDNIEKMFYCVQGEFAEIPHTEVYVTPQESVVNLMQNILVWNVHFLKF